MDTRITHQQTSKLGPLAAAIALALAHGCGADPGPARFPVSGKVTLGGEPLPSGAVTFIPTARGPAVGGTIEGGAFAVGRSEGPGPGSYRVEITSVRATGKQVRSPDDPSATVEEVRNVVPARYNVESQLQVVVKPDAENAFEFDLSAREDRPRGRRVAGREGRQKGRPGRSYLE